MASLSSFASCESNGNATHFCLPFFFSARGVFGCDVPVPFSLLTVCSLTDTDDSTASARLGQSLGYTNDEKSRDADNDVGVVSLVEEKYQVGYLSQYESNWSMTIVAKLNSWWNSTWLFRLASRLGFFFSGSENNIKRKQNGTGTKFEFTCRSEGEERE